MLVMIMLPAIGRSRLSAIPFLRNTCFHAAPLCPSAPLKSTIFYTFSTFARPSASMSSPFYSLKATKPNAEVLDFADLKGKTVLIVNTASAW